VEPEAHGQFALAAARNAKKTMEKGGKSTQPGSFAHFAERDRRFRGMVTDARMLHG